MAPVDTGSPELKMAAINSCKDFVLLVMQPMKSSTCSLSEISIKCLDAHTEGCVHGVPHLFRWA